MSDPGNLQNLNDIVLPVPAHWWPPAPGWYVLAGLLLAVLALLALRWLRRWRLNAYRRQALKLLSGIRDGHEDLRQLPALLKRAALSAFSRPDVAALSGMEWHAFLDRSGGGGRFGAGAGVILDRLSYASADGEPPDAAERLQVLDAVESWLRRHPTARREARS